MTLIAKRLRIMARVFLVGLSLLFGTQNAVQAQIAQSETILGPDGRGPAPRAPRAAQPSLEEQLRRKKARDPVRPLPDEPATRTEELLTPEEKREADALQESMNLKDVHPRFRMHLGLAPTWAQKISGPVSRFRFDPGQIWQAAFRVTDPERSVSFWTGLYLAAWNGTAASDSSFSRFAVLYAGPHLAFEWRGSIRQNLAFGLAGMSRQADQEFPGVKHRLATRTFGLDGSGLWMNYGLGFHLARGWEWETKAGVQTGAAYMLSYLSIGVSLWTD
jgi:hypothetical protein